MENIAIGPDAQINHALAVLRGGATASGSVSELLACVMMVTGLSKQKTHRHEM
ncbi:MAG: hypothetical protein ACP5DX_16510 [Paracoccaceae bacterium]